MTSSKRHAFVLFLMLLVDSNWSFLHLRASNAWREAAWTTRKEDNAFVLQGGGRSTNDIPLSNNAVWKQNMARSLSLSALFLPLSSASARSSDGNGGGGGGSGNRRSSTNRLLEQSSLDDDTFRKAEVNAPSDDFWYPPYLIGNWDVDFKFLGASFTDKIPLETLAKGNNLPGFANYSVFFLPNMGQDASNVSFRYVQIDSHPREDHPHNLRSLVKAFKPDATIDEAPYSFQKAPDWFHSPANRWSIKYHDSTGSGQVDLFTQKRVIRTFAGTVQTIEFFRQTHRRREQQQQQQQQQPDSERKIVSDYALNWKLSVPAALRDEFITVEDLRKSTKVVGTLEVLVYLPITSDLYLQAPGRPAGVFSYNITMQRKADYGDGGLDTETTVYPFVWRDDGPVELDKYFGY